ncbi:MAG: ChbG/HpnK family deacetylase [Acidobacteria bacterium]|nr:ChbG/HpnK family deacetylase [Acidobacteriota bacterium]
MRPATRRLVVNADDFGFSRDVNAGIVEAFQRGIVRSTTLMANGAAFDDAVRLARAHPGLDVGCHLTLVEAPGLPVGLAGLIRAVALRRIPIYEELAGQVRRILDAGIHLTHLDTHKHTHLLPPVLKAVCRIAREFGIPWVRRPVLFRARGCRTTDHFAGFTLTGRLDTAALVRVIRNLRPGLTEFMCHPGRCGPELEAARTRLKASRERELEALCAPEVREALQSAQVQLVSYREL